MSYRDDRLQSKSGYRREDRYRSRSRSRSRSRDRSRKHRRSRSTSRGRRSRSRSRSTDRYHRSRSRSSSRDRDRRKKSRRSRSRSRSMSPAPAQGNNSKGKQVLDTKSLMLKGLKLTTDEYMIHEIMSQFGAVVEVRLVKDKTTGEPRGFAFVDYATPQEAQSVIDQTRAVVTIDGVNATLDYAYAKPTAPPPPKFEPLDAKSDWVCPKCAGNNFARRAQCYYCQTPKPAFVQTTPSSASSLHPNDIPPSNVVIVKGLEPFTTEETLLHTFQLYGPIKEIRLIRDKITRASRCFCFVEFNTLEDAAKAVNSSDRLRIDEKFVKISYTVARGINPNLPEAIEQVKWAAAMQNYYDSTYGGGQPVSAPQPSDYETYKAINNGEIASRYVFDPKSRHYYDSQTGVYYDPEQNYFWDSFNNTYYMYDPVTKKYEKQKQQTAADANKEKKAEQKKANPTKSIATKKISKEFERWSKTGQELQKPAPKEKKVHHQYPPPNQAQPTSEPAPLAEAPTYDDASLNAQFVNGLICMLCKRQLPSAEALQKHLDKSELHKNNLQAYKLQLTGNNTQTTENTANEATATTESLS